MLSSAAGLPVEKKKKKKKKQSPQLR